MPTFRSCFLDGEECTTETGFVSFPARLPKKGISSAGIRWDVNKVLNT
jgi:hypothetical protein